MHEVYLGLGGNVGDVRTLILRAFALLESHPDIYQLKRSKIIETEPVSDLDQPKYLNAACQIWTPLDPLNLFSFTQRIERMLGKVPKPKNAPRPIDIDILIYGNLEGTFEDLEIPHPRWMERSFVLEPLMSLGDSVPTASGRLELESLIAKN